MHILILVVCDLRKGINIYGMLFTFLSVDSEYKCGHFLISVFPAITYYLKKAPNNSSSEFEVGTILSLLEKSLKRNKLWKVLVNKGDFAHYFSVFKKGKGMSYPNTALESKTV